MRGLDVRFHREVAASSGNPVLVALVELVSALVYDRRRLTIEQARREMEYHLDTARLNQLREGTS